MELCWRVVGEGGEALCALLLALPGVHVLGDKWAHQKESHQSVLCKGELKNYFLVGLVNLLFEGCQYSILVALYLASEVWSLWGVGSLRTGLVTAIYLIVYLCHTLGSTHLTPSGLGV